MTPFLKLMNNLCLIGKWALYVPNLFEDYLQSPLVMGFDVRIGMQSFISLMVEICEHINKVSSSRKYSLKRHIILA